MMCATAIGQVADALLSEVQLHMLDRHLPI